MKVSLFYSNFSKHGIITIDNKIFCTTDKQGVHYLASNYKFKCNYQDKQNGSTFKDYDLTEKKREVAHAPANEN